MSATSSSTIDRSGQRSWGPCGMRRGGDVNWSGFNIAAMVAGFVFFWPVGLAVLLWILAGRDARELPGAVRQAWSRAFGGSFGRGDRSSAAHGGNSVFEAFQQTQHDRINELREEIRERSRRFREFRAESRRRADQEEFDRFMSSAPAGETDRAEG